MIARKTWREIRMMALAYTLLLEAMLIPAVLMWPEVRDNRTMQAFKKLMPADFLADMFDQMSTADNAAFRAYMAVQMFFKGINVVGIACAVLLGTGMIARERENSTLEFLLSRPISRGRVLWSKFWVTALAVIAPIFLTSLTALPLAKLVDEELPLAEVMLATAHSAAFALALLAATCLTSIRIRTQVHVAFVIGAFIIVQVAVFFIPAVRQFSLFRLSDFDVYGPILAGNLSGKKLLLGYTIWLIAGAVICYVLAHRWLKRADL